MAALWQEEAKALGYQSPTWSHNQKDSDYNLCYVSINHELKDAFQTSCKENYNDGSA